jgi:Ohr subfamily peroxiredoxin
MAKAIYTASGTATGGRSHGHGWTDNGTLDVQIRRPAEMGGEEPGTNPEQLFAVGYAACFDNALMRAAERQHLETGETTVNTKVSLLPNGTGGYLLAVELAASLPAIDDIELAKSLVAAAHQVCPYSNATRGNIEVKLFANGVAV